MSEASAGRSPVPLTVVGGFLGAGKTTLVNHVLAQADGRRLAILVNDFGALSIDAALVSSASARTIALANGCVCCTLVNGLVEGLIDVLALDPPPDHVLVEASGVADPRRIAQIARADRAFAQDATWVVAAADRVRSLAGDRYVGDTVMRQLDGADIVLLNKTDLVTLDDAVATAAWIRDVAPRARIVRAAHARLPLDVVVGSRAPSESRAASPAYVAADDHGARFASRTYRCETPLSRAALERALDALPEAVLRAKGFVRFDDAPERAHIVQAVGRRSRIEPARQPSPAGSTLVIVAVAEMLRERDLDGVARLFAR